MLRTKIFEAVTKDVDVTEQELLTYYTENQSQFGSPDSRDVRHILIAEKNKDGSVDFEASKAKADEVYAQLKGGAGFAALAKRITADPGSKDGGREADDLARPDRSRVREGGLRARQGRDREAGEERQYGYYVIQAISDVRKGKSFDDVKAVVRAKLLQQKRNEAAQAWSEDVTKDYEGKVRYAAGYELPQLPEEPTDTQ